MPPADPFTPTVTVAHRARPGHRSQDRHLVLAGAVAVFDGATDPDRPPTRDGGWYAEQLTRTVATRITDPQLALADVVARSIADVAAAHQLRPGDSPSSTATLLRWSALGGAVEALVLADTVLVVRHADGSISTHCDNRIDDYAAEPHRGYRQRLAAGCGYDDEHRRLMRDLGSFLAAGRNRAGGFWVAEADPAAAGEALVLRFDPGTVREAAILTDGASVAVDSYGVFPDWAAALDVIGTAGPAALLRAVREAEATDPQGRRWPRAKPHDDATVVHLDFAGGWGTGTSS